MENNVKTGHPVLGVVLALLGVVIALFLTFLTGAIGGGVALLLGLAAVILGVKARKGSKKGLGAIVTGVIAVLLAVVMTVGSVGTITALRDAAAKNNPDSLVAKSADKPYLGVVGMLLSLPQDEASLQTLMEELNELQEAGVIQADTEAK